MRKHLFIKLTAIILVVVTLFSVSALTISAASNNKNNSVTQKEPVAKSKKNHNYTDNLKEINDKLDKLISKDNKVIKNLKDAKAAEKVAGDLTKTLITAFTDPDKLDKNFAIDACAEVINLAAACLGFGGIAEAITGPIAGLIKGDSPSEIELLQEHIDEQFEIVHEELEEVRNDISDLSKHMDESFAAVIKELEDAIEAQAAGEKVYAFTSSGVGNFDYTLFKNYVYGSSTEASDMSNQAYYDKLLLAIANDASDEVIEEYYNSLYKSLTTIGNERKPYIYVMRQYVMEDEFGYSIQRYYYDWLSGNRDELASKGKDAEWEAILFTLDLYRTMLGAENCVLTCDNYFLTKIYLEYGTNPPSDAFYKYTSPDGNVTYVKYTDLLLEVENLSDTTREKALVDQMIKDIVYILNMENSYILESVDGSFYPVNNVDEVAFGQVRTGQTVYMNRLSDEICAFFGLDPQEFTYVWTGADGKIIDKNTGMLQVPVDCNNFVATLYYDGTVIYSQTFSIDNDNYFCGGDGTEDDPFLISDANQRLLIECGRDGRDLYYKLTNDIDFNSQEVQSLGDDKNAFEGVLDGNGYSIKNISVSSSANTGLFAKIGVNGTVKNLTLDNMTVSGTQGGTYTIYAGGITAKNEGRIENCHLTGSKIILARETNERGEKSNPKNIETYVGGLAGLCSGSQAVIAGCTVTSSTIEGISERVGKKDSGKNYANENDLYVAGIVAKICDYAKIENCIVEDQTVIKGKATTYDDCWDTDVYITLRVCGAVAYNSMNDHKYVKNVYVSPDVVLETSAYNPKHKKHKDHISATSYQVVPPIWNIENIWDSDSAKYSMPTREEVSVSEFERPTDVSFTYSGETNTEYNYNENQVYIYDEDFLKTAEAYVENGVESERDILNLSVNSNDGFTLDSYNILGYYGLDTRKSDKTDGEEHVVTLIFNAVLKKEGYANKSAILSVDIPIVVEKIKPTELVVVQKPTTQYTDIGDLITLTGGKFELHWEDGSIDTNINPQIVSQKNITAWGTSTVEITYNGINTTYSVNAACTNHNYEEAVEKATCNREGYTIHTCTKCGHHYTDNVVDKIPHTIIIQNAVEATCKTNGTGYTGDKYCTACEKVIEYGTVIDVLQHQYEYIDATRCKCKVCNSSNTYTPHTYKTVENDKYIYYVCTKCGYEPAPVQKTASTTVSHIVVGQSYGLVDRDYEITVYVKIFNNPGITGLNIRIEYDQRLEFIRAEKGEVLKFSSVFEDAHGKGVIGIVSADAYEMGEDGNLLKLVFKLPKDAKIADKYPISIGCGNEFTDANADLVSLVTADGFIKAVSHLPGDINNDEVVDMLDTTLLARYLAIDNIKISNPSEYETLYNEFMSNQNFTFSEFYADVNLDGQVNLPDLVIMLQYFVGNNTQELVSNEFEVILNPNNGSLNLGSIVVKAYDENGNSGVYPELPVPSRPGYRFEGWYTSFDALDPKTVEVKAGDKVTYNPTFLYQTLYAYWSEEVSPYKIIFDANGGSGTMLPSEHNYDVEKNLPDNVFTKKGYSFRGWNTKADGSGKWYADKEQVFNLVPPGTDSITLYAQWTPNSYTVKYDANGGVGTTSASAHVYNTYAQLTSNGFSKIGYAFVGWNTQPDGSGVSYANLENIMNLVTEDGGSLTLYAQWDIITYTITYFLNDGKYQDGLTYSGSYTVEDLPTVSDPTHPLQRAFEGWFEDQSFDTPLNLDTLASSPRNLNLYAKWNPYRKYYGISATPNLIADTRVIIDWSNATADTAVANGVLSVANTVKELIIVGNPDLTYTNFSISLVDFAKDQELVICFDNFNFTTNVDGAIKTSGIDNGMILTIDVRGTCSIDTSVAGGSIIKDFTNTLKFTGDGKITITAGTGSEGKKGWTADKHSSDGGNGGTGEAGKAGGVAISASSVEFSDTVIAEIRGGTGGAGGTGGNAVVWGFFGDKDGGKGGAGGAGGNAIVADTLTISQTATVSVYGGDGGNGGNGGYRDTRYNKKGSGGKGGAGGAGASAVSADTTVNGSLNVTDGSNGSSGKTGGDWDSQKNYEDRSYWQ